MTSYREDYVQMISNAYTKEELKKLAGDFPIEKLLISENVNLKTDYHAPDFLRVNVNVSQFDKFYETFDIKEGDRMYTKPEDRLSVW